MAPTQSSAMTSGPDQAKVEPPPLSGTWFFRSVAPAHPAQKTTHQEAYSHCQAENTSDPVHLLHLAHDISLHRLLRYREMYKGHRECDHCKSASASFADPRGAIIQKVHRQVASSANTAPRNGPAAAKNVSHLSMMFLPMETDLILRLYLCQVG